MAVKISYQKMCDGSLDTQIWNVLGPSAVWWWYRETSVMFVDRTLCWSVWISSSQKSLLELHLFFFSLFDHLISRLALISEHRADILAAFMFTWRLGKKSRICINLEWASCGHSSSAKFTGQQPASSGSYCLLLQALCSTLSERLDN